MKLKSRSLNLVFFCAILMVVMAGCSSSTQAPETIAACQPTEALWIKPPADDTVSGEPEFGHYFANKDRSILAAAWFLDHKDEYLTASGDGLKLGMFRPAGETLTLTGQRLDGEAPPLTTHVPCCYSGSFQSTGIEFPSEGCWEVTATAADSELSFVVEVSP